MKYLSYKTKKSQINFDEIFIEDVAITDIAKEIGSPFYCYSKKNFQENFLEFKHEIEEQNFLDYKICYAIKANFNLHLIKILASHGAGIDAVSAGEIFVALEAGIDPKKIVFAGVGKTREEIINGIEQITSTLEASPQKGKQLMLEHSAEILNIKKKVEARAQSFWGSNIRQRADSPNAKSRKFEAPNLKKPDWYVEE